MKALLTLGQMAAFLLYMAVVAAPFILIGG
jgi:hypothetical protein